MPVILRQRLGDLADCVAEERQIPRGRDAGVEQLERSGGRVAGIGECGLPRLGSGFVQCHERLRGHVDLAPNLQHVRHLLAIVQTQRNRPDRPDVCGDIVAYFAVASRGAGCQNAILVSQADRQAVDLQLDHIVVIGRAQLLANPLVERLQLIGVVCVVDAQHGDAMANRGELPQRPASDALRGRVRRHQLRVLRLQPLELCKQLVILLVRNLRRVLDVVQVVVPADLPPEPIHSFADFLCHRHIPAKTGPLCLIPYGSHLRYDGPVQKTIIIRPLVLPPWEMRVPKSANARIQVRDSVTPFNPGGGLGRIPA